MTLPERIRRLTVALVYHLLPRSPARGYGEQEASMTLYSTSHRSVHSTLKKRPGSVDADRVAIHEEQTHGCTR